MVSKKSRAEVRIKKHNRMRNRFSGTAERPRLSVFRSNNHMYAQVIDDTAGNVILVSVSEKIEFLLREKRSKEVERNPVSDELGTTSVDVVDLDEREILVSFSWRTDFSGYGIARLESVDFDLCL